MNLLFHILSQVISLFLILFSFLFFVYSIIEKEKKAAIRIIPIGLLLFVFAGFVYLNLLGFYFHFIFILLFTTGLLVVILPFRNRKVVYEIQNNRFDERDIMFSRMELKEGTDRFNSYYQNRPENKASDDLFRKEPGLLNENSKYYDQFAFNAALASFSTVNLLHPLVENKIQKDNQTQVNTREISAFIKNWGIKLGAADVGFALLQPHHIYSHAGRGEAYGKVVNLPHKYAIAFTVEMNHESLSHAPKGPVIMESAQQYLNAGTIAIQIAELIRNLGFDARAHIDANYRVIAPIVAQVAGLGTIGRMGLLMTPKLGPRVRIGVVSTNLDVEINPQPIESSLIHFCEICKKCASNCPSNSIPSESAIKGSKLIPWKINHEKCFTYWCKAGTDCGRCISVCPYSHPNNFIHNIVRWGIRRNPVNRWLALLLDDYFYGKKPVSVSMKKWMRDRV